MSLIPGLLSDDALWGRQTAVLSSFGEVHVANVTMDDEIGRMADRLLAVTPKKFVLIAHSMGGYVAFDILRRFPERVLALGLFSTTVSSDSPARKTERSAAIASLAKGKFAGLTSHLLPRLVYDFAAGTVVAKEIEAMARRLGPEVYVRQQNAALHRQDFQPVPESIKGIHTDWGR